jgi:hypothetical protein
MYMDLDFDGHRTSGSGGQLITEVQLKPNQQI